MSEAPSDPLPVGFQAVPATAAPSGAATAISLEVLGGHRSVAACVELIAEHLGALARVDTVVAALTTFAPDDPGGWLHLGGRAWLREWRRPDSPCRVLPTAEAGAGPETALAMPYISQVARRLVAAIPDSAGLPPAAGQDRREMDECGARGLVARALVADGTMYGGLSLGSATPGPWRDDDVADVRLLSAALASRMAAEQAKRATAEALSFGEQARAGQQQFFATIGHELRTPISAIVGFAEMLGEDAEDKRAASPELAEFAEAVARDCGIILRAGDQLLAIIEDLLSAGRVLGRESPREDIDVVAAVEDVIHWHRTPALSGEVTLTCSVPAGATVHASASGLRQVLTNLVGNAIVHNRPGGSVEITSRPSTGERGEPRLRIAVRDDGPGMSGVEVERAFEPFVRFADSDVRGTGLGLPLARTIAERDGGLVGAESTPGAGCVFWVDLPSTAG